MLLFSVALKAAAGLNGSEGEKTNSSLCSHRNRPGIFGSKEIYSVESHWLSRESFISGFEKRNLKFPNCATSSFALVYSKLTVFRLHEDKKIIPTMIGMDK